MHNCVRVRKCFKRMDMISELSKNCTGELSNIFAFGPSLLHMVSFVSVILKKQQLYSPCLHLRRDQISSIASSIAIELTKCA